MSLGVALLAGAPLVQAQLVPKDFAVRDAKSIHGVLLDEGVFLGADNAAIFSCAEVFGEVDSLLWTGRDAHAVVLGVSGAWLTAESGCHWRRTTGAVDGQRVVGYYQSSEGSDRVVFAVDDPFGGTAIIETVDGGFTSSLTGSLAVTDASFVAMAGDGGNAALGARTDEGELRSWWSSDGGETFVLAEGASVQVSEGLRHAGYASSRLWMWDDGVLIGVDAQGDVESEAPPVSTPGPVAGADDGTLWLAAGNEGLWYRGDDGAWAQAHSEPTYRVKMAYGSLWVARSADHAGVPMVLRSDDDGVSWWPVWLSPESWDYAPTCESSLSQLCDTANIALQEALGLQVAAEIGPTPSPPVDDEITGCSGTRGAPSWAFLAYLCAALFVGTRRQVPGSP